MSTFFAKLRSRAAGAAQGMSPRTKQWTAATAICGGGVALLWVVFSAGSGDNARRAAAAAAKSDVKPTNVDLMAPGAQVKDSEVWIGKAGKELEIYKADKEEQRRLNREVSERHQEVMRRLAEMEERLKARPQDPARTASASAGGPGAGTEASPPDAALPRAAASLPPAPPPPVAYPRGGAMPAGAPADTSPSGIHVATAPPQPRLMRVTLPSPNKPGDAAEGSDKKSRDSFLPVSFTRGQLIGGLDAPTGGQAQGNPHPVLIRLSDNSVLPNRFRAEYRECFVIGAGFGDISAERAYIRTELLSCVRPNGDPLEVKIQGSIFGEDGKVGMRGKLVTKQGQMLANALLAGVVSGIGQGFALASTTTSTSALGTVATASGTDAVVAGFGAGIGKALDRLAQYYIKLAEQTFPIIEIDAGREIDVVLTKGVRIEGGAADISAASPTTYPNRSEPSERYMKVSNDED